MLPKVFEKLHKVQYIAQSGHTDLYLQILCGNPKITSLLLKSLDHEACIVCNIQFEKFWVIFLDAFSFIFVPFYAIFTQLEVEDYSRIRPQIGEVQR